MPRHRQYLDMSCVDAARKRIEHIYEIADTVCLSFSGGKDSTACLLLMKEFHDAHGLGPVRVIFRDEEFVAPTVARYVEWVSTLDWVDMEWYCLPQGTELWVLGQREYVLLWSPLRHSQGRLMREMPAQAIHAGHFGLDPTEPIPHPIDYYTMANKSGQVIFINGVRANESMQRYRSVVQKLNENYIAKPFKLPKGMPLRFGKPIYDWVTNDVFKFCYDSGFPHCEYYDRAVVAGANTRVGHPLHAVASRRINDVIVTEPEFYDEIVRCFPHFDAQRRLWKDFDIEALIAYYVEAGWAGVKDCIDENVLTPGLRQVALAFAAEYRDRHAKDAYSYPLDHLIRTLLLKAWHHSSPSPVGPGTRAHTMRVVMNQTEEDAYDMKDDENL